MSFVAGAGLTNCDILYSGMPRIPNEGEEVFAKGFDIQLGGGVPATMINLARLNVPVKFATYLGNDLFSHFVEDELRKNRVEFENIYTGSGIPICITSAVLTANDRTFISYRDDFEISDEDLSRIYNQFKGAKIVEMQIGYLGVYKKLKNEGVKLIFDTGWEDDLSIEKYSEYIELADYYTPSSKEALKITGASDIDGAVSVLEKYFDHVIVKLDKDGCMISENGEKTLIPPMKNVHAIDATGAGDAFLSGVLYGLYNDYSFKDCVKFGNVTGGTCVQGVGCLSRFVTEEELLKLAKTIG